MQLSFYRNSFKKGALMTNVTNEPNILEFWKWQRVFSCKEEYYSSFRDFDYIYNLLIVEMIFNQEIS